MSEPKFKVNDRIKLSDPHNAEGDIKGLVGRINSVEHRPGIPEIEDCPPYWYYNLTLEVPYISGLFPEGLSNIGRSENEIELV